MALGVAGRKYLVVCAGMISVSKIEDINPNRSYLKRVRLA